MLCLQPTGLILWKERMGKKEIIFVLNFIFSIFIIHAKENQCINDKIDFLLKDSVIEVDSEELKSFRSKEFEKKLISSLKKIDPTNKITNSLSDFIGVGNYKILNAIKINENNIFFNYLIRENENVTPKNEVSEETLGRFLIKHHVIFIYDKNKKEITDINYLYVQYTPMLFHKYEYNGKCVLYGIGNNSSFGMVTTDMYLLVFSTDNLALKFSDCILFSQEFYSKDIDDIEFEKDFIFNNEKIEIKGKEFDFNKNKYIDYYKVYNLF